MAGNRNGDKALPALTRADAAAKELRRRILDGALPVGHQLKQVYLAEQFKMSRIPLREALRQLEAEGLVSIVPYKGAIVSRISLAEVEELFNLRALLECRLLALSAPHLLSADFREIDRIMADFDRDLERNKPEKWGEMNTRLHMALYKHCKQPKTLGIVHSLLMQTDRFTRLQISLTAGHSRVQKDHRALVQACRDGLFGEAVIILRTHIERAATLLAKTGLLSRIASDDDWSTPSEGEGAAPAS